MSFSSPSKDKNHFSRVSRSSEAMRHSFNAITDLGAKEDGILQASFPAPLQGNVLMGFNGSNRKSNNHNATGLPDNIKAGIESLSGISLEDVQVQYNSSKPSEHRALAYTQGSDIYVAPGQDKHLAHEAWHVVQQKQGRVQSTTLESKGAAINDDEALEREADMMGESAIVGNSSSLIYLQSSSNSISTSTGPSLMPATDAGFANPVIQLQSADDEPNACYASDEPDACYAADMEPNSSSSSSDSTLVYGAGATTTIPGSLNAETNSMLDEVEAAGRGARNNSIMREGREAYQEEFQESYESGIYDERTMRTAEDIGPDRAADYAETGRSDIGSYKERLEFSESPRRADMPLEGESGWNSHTTTRQQHIRGEHGGNTRQPLETGEERNPDWEVSDPEAEAELGESNMSVYEDTNTQAFENAGLTEGEAVEALEGAEGLEAAEVVGGGLEAAEGLELADLLLLLLL
jgi:hypothetical protein